MLRSYGARLAVPLILVTIVILVGLEIARSPQADAFNGCRPTQMGIVCGFTGSTSSAASSSTPGARTPTATALPPLRYLAISGGRCWYWSRYLPGFDSWNSAYDQSIILTRWRLPQCNQRRPTKAPVVVIDISARAWTVFRAFPLDAPQFSVSPEIGITNLPRVSRIGSRRSRNGCNIWVSRAPQ